MKIAYITTHFPFGSGEAFFQPEVAWLQHYADTVYVIATRPLAKESRYPSVGAVNVHIPLFGPAVLAACWREILRHPGRALKELLSVLFSRYRWTAKVKNVLVFPKALALADATRALGVEHIHAQWLTTSATVAFVASRLTGIPWSCTAHQHDIFFDNLVPEKAKTAAFIRVISERNRRHLLEQIDAKSWARTHMVHVGVDIPADVCAPPKRATLEILCAARLEPMKGHEFLLRALRLAKDRGLNVACTLAGDGYLRDKLRAQIDSLSLRENVTMRGIVAHDVLLEELRRGRYDVAVIASTEDPGEHEGIPVAIMEAMAAAVPCICTCTGSLEELIDSEVGVLVPQRDVEALAVAILRLGEDRAARLAMGASARRRIIEDYDIAATTETLYRFIRETSPR